MSLKPLYLYILLERYSGVFIGAYRLPGLLRTLSDDDTSKEDMQRVSESIVAGEFPITLPGHTIIKYRVK